MANNYQRLFYIFKNMDNDVVRPTGYIKVEINYETTKLQISLSNLSNSRGVIYQLYGIKKEDKQLIYTVICDIPHDNGKADVRINLDKNFIGTSQLQLEDINIFAVIAKPQNRISSIQCPLVAYTRGERVWKAEFESLIINKEFDVSISIENELEQKRETLARSETFQDVNAGIVAGNEKKELINRGIIIDAPISSNEFTIDESNEVVNKEQDLAEKVDNEEQDASKEVRINEDISIIEAADSKVKELEQLDTEETSLDDVEAKVISLEELEADEKVQSINRRYSVADKFEAEITSIYKAHKSSELEQERVSEENYTDNDILSAVEKNFKDISSIEIGSDDRVKTEFNLPRLKEELDKSFESYNPFKIKSKNFRWWKINSPGYLNNILFRNNIKTYLFFNPNVMLAHYKYRYIIFGIRNDRRSGKEYFICGVPGVYSIDENPFGNMGSWSQIEGYRPKYGAFGYWVIMIDPRTGKFIKIK